MAGVPRTCSRRCRREIFGPCFSRIDPPAFIGWLYGQRNAVERFFNRLKYFRATATRYDNRDDNYLASVKLASLRMWLRFNESVT